MVFAVHGEIAIASGFNEGSNVVVNSWHAMQQKLKYW
jgi:hypothetical protein